MTGCDRWLLGMGQLWLYLTGNSSVLFNIHFVVEVVLEAPGLVGASLRILWGFVWENVASEWAVAANFRGHFAGGCQGGWQAKLHCVHG